MKIFLIAVSCYGTKYFPFGKLYYKIELIHGMIVGFLNKGFIFPFFVYKGNQFIVFEGENQI